MKEKKEASHERRMEEYRVAIPEVGQSILAIWTTRRILVKVAV